MLQKLTYSRFAIANIDDANLDRAELEPYPTVPESKFRWSILINEEAVQAVLEDWFKGNDISWTYWIDCIMIVLSGECEVTLWQPPNWTDKHVVVAKKGDIFICPRGARATFKVLSDEPFRHIALDVPNAGYDEEGLAAGTAERASESARP